MRKTIRQAALAAASIAIVVCIVLRGDSRSAGHSNAALPSAALQPTLRKDLHRDLDALPDGIGALSVPSNRTLLPLHDESAPPSTSVEPSLSASDAVLSLAATVSGDSALTYTQEIDRLRIRIAWLETELDLCGSEVTQGPVGRWLATLRPEERPSSKTLHLVSDYVRPYPVELAPEEGLWVAERIEQDDWIDWGPTIDEAIIRFLGVGRLKRDLPPDVYSELQNEWEDAGIF